MHFLSEKNRKRIKKLWSWEKRNTMKGFTRHIEFCPVTYTAKGEKGKAQLVDLSAVGAKIRINSSQRELPITQNDEVALSIKTPYGISDCTAKVQWIENNDFGVFWGVKFTSRSEARKDPLRCMVDSPIA